jgi:hypothetical protein
MAFSPYLAGHNFRSRPVTKWKTLTSASRSSQGGTFLLISRTQVSRIVRDQPQKSRFRLYIYDSKFIRLARTTIPNPFIKSYRSTSLSTTYYDDQNPCTLRPYCLGLHFPIWYIYISHNCLVICIIYMFANYFRIKHVHFRFYVLNVLSFSLPIVL